MEFKAWFCPSCQKHHGPHVDTCPGAAGAMPAPAPLYRGHDLVARPACPVCGMIFEGAMGYVCANSRCPMGGAYLPSTIWNGTATTGGVK